MTSSGSAGRKKSKARPGVSYPGLEQLGDFIKTQRKMMELSQRELARLMEVSDPYVSQLERGMHEPSVRVLKSLAGALNVRAETLLAYAGLLDPDQDQSQSSVVEAIQSDPHLSDEQKSTLLSVYQNFRATAPTGGPTGADVDDTDRPDQDGGDES